MKLLISGSRQVTDYDKIASGADELAPDAILHGGAEGADQLAQAYADLNGLPTEVIRPDYQKHPWKVAPLERNTELVNRADAVLAIYATGRRRQGGTWDTVQKALRAGLPVLELEEGTDWRRDTPRALTLL